MIKKQIIRFMMKKTIREPPLHAFMNLNILPLINLCVYKVQWMLSLNEVQRKGFSSVFVLQLWSKDNYVVVKFQKVIPQGLGEHRGVNPAGSSWIYAFLM